jgi:hypothetical protein
MTPVFDRAKTVHRLDGAVTVIDDDITQQTTNINFHRREEYGQIKSLQRHLLGHRHAIILKSYSWENIQRPLIVF